MLYIWVSLEENRWSWTKSWIGVVVQIVAETVYLSIWYAFYAFIAKGTKHWIILVEIMVMFRRLKLTDRGPRQGSRRVARGASRNKLSWRHYHASIILDLIPFVSLSSISLIGLLLRINSIHVEDGQPSESRRANVIYSEKYTEPASRPYGVCNNSVVLLGYQLLQVIHVRGDRSTAVDRLRGVRELASVMTRRGRKEDGATTS